MGDRAVRALGRTLQHVALLFPPLAVIMELTHGISLGQLLLLGLVAPACLFWIGRIVEGYGGGGR